jgi:thiamine pyrophosphate-dependent acetolactate synthase large subunit-like protein
MAAILALAFGVPARVGVKLCTQAQAIQAEADASILANWDEVLRSYR